MYLVFAPFIALILPQLTPYSPEEMKNLEAQKQHLEAETQRLGAEVVRMEAQRQRE